MKYTKITTDSIVKIAIISAVLIISFSVFYYLVIFLPKNEEMKLTLLQNDATKQKSELEHLEKKRQTCLDEAGDSYTLNWIKTSEAEGLIKPVTAVTEDFAALPGGEYKMNKKTGKRYTISEHYIWNNERNYWIANNERAQLTRLPANQSERMKDFYQEAKEMCLKLYPVK